LIFYNVQIFKKIIKILRNKKNVKKQENQKKTQRKPAKKEEKLTYRPLTGRPNITSTRAEQDSAPLTGGA
jgi:hypothetical protein